MKAWATIGSLAVSTVLAHGSAVRAQDIRDGLILLYEFEEGSGDTVTDTSGFMSPLDLTIQDPGNVTWGSGFLTVDAPTIITNPDPPQKIYDSVIPANALSLEAWVMPDNPSLTGPARIFNISSPVPAEAPTNRNFQLGQDGEDIQARLRSDTSTSNGAPYINTNFTGPVVSEPTELLHLVYTRAPSGNAAIYVDGELYTDPAAMQGGDLSGWVDSYLVALAHEHEDPSADSRSFQGDYHLIAMWNRALSEADVMQRFQDGPVAPGGMPLVPGDFNADGVVTEDDFFILSDNFAGHLDGPVGRAEGDINFDGRVDFDDFSEFKALYPGVVAQATAIPEPAAITLLGLAMAALAAGYVRKHGRRPPR